MGTYGEEGKSFQAGIKIQFHRVSFHRVVFARADEMGDFFFVLLKSGNSNSGKILGRHKTRCSNERNSKLLRREGTKYHMN